MARAPRQGLLHEPVMPGQVAHCAPSSIMEAPITTPIDPVMQEAPAPSPAPAPWSPDVAPNAPEPAQAPDPVPLPDTCFDCNADFVEDASVVVSCYLGLLIGLFSLIAFSLLWRHVKVYTSRQRLRNVSFKPPVVPTHGCFGMQRFWGWMSPVLFTPTVDVYHAAGFDAVVMLKTIEFGVQLFTPMALINLAVLVPVHSSGDGVHSSGVGVNKNASTSNIEFMRFTIANLPRSSKLYWLHFSLAYVFVLYALWLIKHHYEAMVELRRRYNISGEDYHFMDSPDVADDASLHSAESPRNGELQPQGQTQEKQEHGLAMHAPLLDSMDTAHRGETSILDTWRGYQAQHSASTPGAAIGRKVSYGPDRPALTMTLDHTINSPTSAAAQERNARASTTGLAEAARSTSGRPQARNSGATSSLLGLGRLRPHSRDSATGLMFTDMIQEHSRRAASPTTSSGSAHPSVTAQLGPTGLSHTLDNSLHRRPSSTGRRSTPSYASDYGPATRNPGTSVEVNGPLAGERPRALESILSAGSLALVESRSEPVGSVELGAKQTVGQQEEETAILPGNGVRSAAVDRQVSGASERGALESSKSSFRVAQQAGSVSNVSGQHSSQPSFADMISQSFDLLSTDVDTRLSAARQSASGDSAPFLHVPPATVRPKSCSTPKETSRETAVPTTPGRSPGSAYTASEPDTPKIGQGVRPLTPVSQPSAGPHSQLRGGKPRPGPVGESKEAPSGGEPLPRVEPLRSSSPFADAPPPAPLPPLPRVAQRSSSSAFNSGALHATQTSRSARGSVEDTLRTNDGAAVAAGVGDAGSEISIPESVSRTPRQVRTQDYVPSGAGAASSAPAEHSPHVGTVPRPAALQIDHPNDALSVGASTTFYRQGLTGAAVTSAGETSAMPAIANDINVIDADQVLADQQHDRTTAGNASVAGGAALPTGRAWHDHTPTSVAAKPIKWWALRGITNLRNEKLKQLLMDEKEYPVEAWNRTWFDPNSILSRKPSVRFRRTVDIHVPLLNEQGETVGAQRRAIEVHKYCILVTDIPLHMEAKLLREQRAEESAAAEAEMAARSASRHGSDAAPLSHSTLSQHANHAAHGGTAHRNVFRWMSQPMRGGANMSGHSSRRTSADGEPLTPPVDAAESGAQAGLRVSHMPVAKQRRANGAVRSRSSVQHQSPGRLAGAPVAEASQAALGAPCIWGGSAAADTMEKGPPPVDARAALRDWLQSTRRASRDATDLRQARACEALAGRLCQSGTSSAPVLDGAEGMRAWMGILQRASVPRDLEEQLCAWVDSLDATPRSSTACGTPSAAYSEASQSDPAESVIAHAVSGADAVEGPGLNARVRRQAVAWAVAEGYEAPAAPDFGAPGTTRNSSDRARTTQSGSSTQPKSRPESQLAVSNHTRRVSQAHAPNQDVLEGAMWFEEEEPHFSKQPRITVDAAAARPACEERASNYTEAVADKSDLLGRNKRAQFQHELRSNINNKVAYAFDLIFQDARPRLVPVLNHKRVHLQLIKWDKLHKNLELIEAKEAKLMQQAELTGRKFKPLTQRIGWCGERVESRQHFLEKIAMVEELIDRERTEVLMNGVAASYFVIFETQFAAAVAAQAVLHSEDARLYRTCQAPGPDNVNWPTLWCTREQRNVRRPFAVLAYAALLCVPIGVFTGLLATVAQFICDEGLNERFPSNSGDGFCDEDSFLRRVVTEILPAVLVIIWQNAVMPNALYSITLFEASHTSLSSLDRRILMLFFWWDVLNIFVGSMLAGSISSYLTEFIERPGTISDRLGQTLPTSSNIFINYLALRAFGLVPFRLILVHGGIWRWLFKCGGRCGQVITERDAAGFMAPASIRYGRELGVIMLVFIIGWAYAVVSPLVVVVAAIYFMSSWVVWRWQVIHVYVRCFEGGGSLWRSIVTCFMNCLLIFVFFTSCVFIAKQAFYQAAVLFVTLPIIIIRYWRICTARYDPALKYIPLEATVSAPRAKINDMSYVAAPLRPKCSGWHPEWGKAWESWGSPSYVFS